MSDEFIHELQFSTDRQTDRHIFHKLKKSTIILCPSSIPWNNCSTWFIILAIMSVSLSASNLTELWVPHLSAQLSEFTLHSFMSSASRVKWRNLVETSLATVVIMELQSSLQSKDHSLQTVSAAWYWIRITCQILVVEYLQIFVDSSLLTV